MKFLKNSQTNPVFVLFGMTGAGKTAVSSEVSNRLKLDKLKNTTTRPQRGLEDTEYNFSSNEDFEKDYEQGRYIAVRKYLTLIEDVEKHHYYGVDKIELAKGGLLITDFEGFKELLERDLNVVGIYIHADTKTRLERAKMREGFKKAEFDRRNADDLLKFDLKEIINLGTNNEIYIIDNSGDASLVDVCDKVDMIIRNYL